MRKLRGFILAVAALSVTILLTACGTGIDGIDQITGQYYLASELSGGGSLVVRPEDGKQAEQVYQKWTIVPAKDVSVQKILFTAVLFGDEEVTDLYVTATAKTYDQQAGTIETAAKVTSQLIRFGERNTLDFATVVTYEAGIPKAKREECAIELEFTREGELNTTVKFKLTEFELVA